jgi:diguanylate cyclase (GGDEF)-like protein/PAS domain S-box-containing protein
MLTISGPACQGAPEQPCPCEQEPIHIPGAIQPHGAVLGMLADGHRISHASANLAGFLGISPEAVLGRTLDGAFAEAACRFLRDALDQAASELDAASAGEAHCLPGPDGGVLHLQAHRSGRHVILDIETLGRESRRRMPVTAVQSVLETFSRAASRAELCELAVRGLRAVTGYDRVMAYRFGEDGHGEVISERRAPNLEPYLGLRYPANDIPPQGRRQYLRQRVGAVANSSYQPVALLADPALDGGTPLDLTHSALRSVSPVHREYMRNMGTAASLTVALVHGEELWGMLVCHHATPRMAGPDTRAAAGMIGQVVSLLLGSIGEAEAFARRHRLGGMLCALADGLGAAVPLPEAVVMAEADLLGLVGAGGAAVRLSGTTLCLGRTPPPLEAQQAVAVLHKAANGHVLAIDDLGIRYPDLASCTDTASGALLLPLAPGTDDAVLWFRPELAQSITWGGNPSSHATPDPETGRLSPRASFAAWKETVRGRSAPWTDADLAYAGELRGVFESEVAKRTRAELAQLRHYDPLTGLPNRSLLEDRLAEVKSGRWPAAAMLFLDLDGFKAVNDTMGHAAGDVLLADVARRLLAAAGQGNLTARLGGDEFVVLCRGMDRDAATAFGECVRQAIGEPFEVFGLSCHVSASIGIAHADQLGGLDLVRAADMAMYAAKQSGGNRVTVFEQSLYDRAARQFELDHDLRDALSRGDEFLLLYQPLFSAAAGKRRLAGFEALLRWRHPHYGWMAPDTFLPMAEKSGLIVPIGDWVLARALRDGLGLRRSRQDTALEIAVNVSAVQLAQPGYCTALADTLRAEGFPPEALCVEVTESMLTDAALSSVVADIRKLGVRVAIDDFGMGYSSLSYLRRLPVDVVKLDRSFLENAAGDPTCMGFVGSVVSVVHAAGMSVVIEGIETHAQLAVALSAGADMLQGFLFAKPLPLQAAAALADISPLLPDAEAAGSSVMGPTASAAASVEPKVRLRLQSNAFEDAGFGIAVTDPKTDTVRVANAAFAAMMGLSRNEAEGMCLWDVYPEDELPRALELAAEADRTGHASFETWHRSGGSSFPVEVDITSIRDRNGAAVCRIVSVFNIAGRRRAAEALRQDMIGLLADGQAGGVEHDFNRLLGIIVGRLDLLAPAVQQDATGSECLAAILDAAMSVADLLQRLLDVFRRQPPDTGAEPGSEEVDGFACEESLPVPILDAPGTAAVL